MAAEYFDFSSIYMYNDLYYLHQDLYTVRPLVNINGYYHQQLVLYEVCRYESSTSEGVYIRFKLDLDILCLQNTLSMHVYSCII